MGRANNVSNALQIVSRQQGWDPAKIEGGGQIDNVHHVRNTPFESSTWPIPDGVNATTTDHPGGPNHTFNTPDVSREKPNHTVNADPAPGIPGAK